MKAFLPALVLLPCLALPAQAEECDGTAFEDSASYTVAVARKKTSFRDDMGKATASYVLKGDEVVILSQVKDMACAEYASVKQATWGWIPLGDLGPLRPPGAVKPAWKGKFLRDELGSFVKLSPGKPGTVAVSAEAYWAMSLEMAKQGGMNIGEVQGQDAVKDGVLHIADKHDDGTDCSIDLRLLSNRYLVVGNKPQQAMPMVCWGHNVTFDGLYVRVSR